MKVSISSLNDINEFLHLAQMAEGDVTVRKGKFCVDGKSPLGVLSLNMSDGAQVDFIPSPMNQPLIDFLAPFEIK